MTLSEEAFCSAAVSKSGLFVFTWERKQRPAQKNEYFGRFKIWNLEYFEYWCRRDLENLKYADRENRLVFIRNTDKMIDCRQRAGWNCSAAQRITEGLFCSPFAPSSVYDSICLSLCIATSFKSPGSTQYVSLWTVLCSYGPLYCVLKRLNALLPSVFISTSHITIDNSFYMSKHAQLNHHYCSSSVLRVSEFLAEHQEKHLNGRFVLLGC